jgi:hypothetical protein
VELWSFPLAAGLLRSNQLAISGLRGTLWRGTAALNMIEIDEQNMVVGAARAGLLGGVAGCVLLVLMQVATHVSADVVTRADTAFSNSFHLQQIGLATLVQGLVAAVVAAVVHRLGWLHGLFAAFLAGLVLSAGAAGLYVVGPCVELLTITPGRSCPGAGLLDSEWPNFLFIVNGGAMLALPAGLVTGGLSSWLRDHRRSRSRIGIDGGVQKESE